MGTGELAKLDLKQMRAYVNVLVSAGNKRIRRLQKNVEKGIAPEALRGVMESGGVFSAKGKDRNQLFREIVRARKFFNSPLSTVKGASNERKRRERALFGETREERAKRMKAERKKAERKRKSEKRKNKSPPEVEEPEDWIPPEDDSFRPTEYDSERWDPEEQLKNTFRAFRMFKAAYPALMKSAGFDSDELLKMMGSFSQRGMSPEESVAMAYQEIMSVYEDMEAARFDADNWEWQDVF